MGRLVRFTAVQRRAGIGYLEFTLKIQCVLPAFSMRCQREFDKYKNVGGRVDCMIDLVSTKILYFQFPPVMLLFSCFVKC